MIGKLNRALTVEIVFVAAFIGLAFRSFDRDAGEHPARHLPGGDGGCGAVAMGEGLQFATVVALTVSFGLGLSATIHFLNRLRLEEQAGGRPGRRRSSGRPSWSGRR